MPNPKPRLTALALALALIASLPLRSHAQDPFEKNLEGRTAVKVLPNGLTLVLCERHEAPVFSFYTDVNVGSANDPGGQSGLAHMFEHMAFKGTTEIGTSNYAGREGCARQGRRRRTPPMTRSAASASATTQRRSRRSKKAFERCRRRREEIRHPESVLRDRRGERRDRHQRLHGRGYDPVLLVNAVEPPRAVGLSRVRALPHPVVREFYKERDVVHGGAPHARRLHRPKGA